VNFGDGMDVVVFEYHGEERRLKDPIEYIGSCDRMVRHYFNQGGRWENSETRLSRHGRRKVQRARVRLGG